MAKTTPTPQEALIWLMVVTSASDRDMTDAELERIGQAVRHSPSFEGFGEEGILPAANACRAKLQEEGGMDEVLSAAARALPQELHVTAYLLAYEVAAIDRSVRIEEQVVLKRIREALDLDLDTVAVIEQEALAGAGPR
ncbi:MAG: tellurite resistance TerB family protein [Rhizobiaceae bacterium]|nr:tellurite resistance TerB family protein [Rhizobiaceae bacterium]MCV0405863.1 tellurite resistance TerB family protein [Rhizobiaceae bacterium]